jgi:hypothetical protein
MQHLHLLYSALCCCSGSLEDGQVFDSTRGGFKYRDGGPGVFRPVVVRLSGSPVPGITLGLQQGIAGMTIGGKRSIKVPAQLGFGQQTVLAPYAIVPAGASLRYDIELLRVSSLGPDMLVKVRAAVGAGLLFVHLQVHLQFTHVTVGLTSEKASLSLTCRLPPTAV